MADDMDRLCPVCMTGVMVPTGDDAGHLTCTVCMVQSQDVVVEELDNERVDVGQIRNSQVKKLKRVEAEDTTIVLDAKDETLLYMKCVQRLIKRQAVVICGWYGCSHGAYDAILKQLWKLMALQCPLLDPSYITKRIRKKPKGFDESDDELSCDEEGEEGGAPLGEGGVANVFSSRAALALMANARGKLPLTMTLVLQLITAWMLKLPMWPSDLSDAARSGQLPFLAVAALCREELKGHNAVRRALQSPPVTVSGDILVKAQEFAHTNEIVVPELNLGAFVCRHCACLGLPTSVATLASHVAAARLVTTRQVGAPTVNSFTPVQKAPVLLPILLVCKHALKCVYKAQEAEEDQEAKQRTLAWRQEMGEWVTRWQSILELQHMHWEERCRIAAQSSMQDFLKFTTENVYYNAEPPGAFARLFHRLQDASGKASEQREQSEKQVKCEDYERPAQLDVLERDCDAEDFAAQVFVQLMRVIAEEMGCSLSTVEKLFEEFENSVTAV